MNEIVFTLTVPDLELPAENVVLNKWSRFRRARETKRVREWVWAHAIREGLANAVPIEKAHVRIVIRGPYGKRDAGSTWSKDALDAITTRPKTKGATEPEWGLIEDDSRECIGTPDIVEEVSDVASVRFEVSRRGT